MPTTARASTAAGVSARTRSVCVTGGAEDRHACCNIGTDRDLRYEKSLKFASCLILPHTGRSLQSAHDAGQAIRCDLQISAKLHALYVTLNLAFG